MGTWNRKVVGGAAAGLLALGVALSLLSRSPRADTPAAGASPGASAGPGQEGTSAARAPGGAAGERPGQGHEALASAMRDKYGARLSHPSIQMHMLENLMRYFQERSPGTWREELLAFLRVNFPERYAELAALLDQRVAYETWIRENEPSMQGLSAEERREALWEKRKELFGEERAKSLWAPELKHQEMRDRLAAIDADEQAGFQEKLSAYEQALKDTHGEKADANLARHQQEAMNQFLDLPSIQEDLGAMSAAERAAALRSLREGMGLDAEALGRWDALDQARDSRWDVGQRYQAERDALAAKNSGNALEVALRRLRERTFGEEAEVIASEEASGFFRFKQPRKWGRN
ncbi:hypothetical protein [Chondromyces apiculatus]|uniref:Lipase modulator n=1 Tax=Chondromyces apiculatus DSM 436 TaxID=1192034 RepID=A0A017TBC8_9BACT|nr:hypothetical protein [Chondromyces apiculatus]EYF06120.1 Hypothetical protein CAP_2310 [Chondromyces apiculatus DSM 436]